MTTFGTVVTAEESAESVDGGRQQQQPEVEATEQESAEPLSIGQINEEIRAIELRMKTDRRAYFADNAAQARYRELLTLREKHEKGTEDKPSDDEDGPNLPDEVVQQWEKAGGYQLNLERARDAALGVVEALDGEEQATLLSSFEDLPQSAQVQIYAHLPIDPAPARPATDEQVELFGSTPEGRQLIAEWGRHAPERIAVVRRRVETIAKSMSEEDRHQVLTWFDGLTERQAKAVLRALAGKRR